MIDWFYQVAEYIAVGGGVLALLLGLIGRLPSLVSLSPLASVSYTHLTLPTICSV